MLISTAKISKNDNHTPYLLEKLQSTTDLPVAFKSAKYRVTRYVPFGSEKLYVKLPSRTVGYRKSSMLRP